ncbi:MAG: hypothetical protein QG656_310 [Candidatus Hydrogenedentes bacterium]|nr:hypothetical protein [Candidatus Hydrogenedentota bacterium]
MTAKRFGKTMVWLRRAVQIASVALFCWLFWSARFRDDAGPGPFTNLLFDFDPLILVATWLSAHAVAGGALLALITVAVTLVFGRVFCGWFCPLGAIHHFAGWLDSLSRRKRRKAQPYNRWQHAKYYLLVALLVMALFGVHWIGVFDPISQLYRVTATVLYPGAQYAIEDGSTAIYHADPHVGPVYATTVTEPVYKFSRDYVFVTDRQAFRNSALIALLFMTALLLNLYRRRFWCRYVCPLGGLLGWLSQRQMLRLTQAHGACKECGRCATVCPAGASPEKPGHWRAPECFGCWNCVPSCNFNAIDFKFATPFRRPSEAKLDLGKRATLAAGAGGVAALLMFRLEPQAQGRTYNPGLIRPPGALDEREFLQRCIQCGLCMKVCPTNGLHPTGFDAGIEGIWTPKLVPLIGYCEYNCNLCGQVCPTEALKPMGLKEKQQFKMGMAVFDRTRCLPWAYDRECMVCEEHCPVADKAIFFKPAEITRRDGTKVTLKQPWVDLSKCTGCGICEAKCVFRDLPAIRVTSANETRHPGNQPVLAGFSGESYFVNDTPAQSGSEETTPDPYGTPPESSNNPYG